MSKVYIGYIAYYISNLNPLISRIEYVSLLTKKLGTSDFIEASLSKLKNLALYFYYRHFIALFVLAGRESDYDKMSTSDMREMLVELDAFFIKFAVDVPVQYYMEEKDVIKHMVKFQCSPNVLTELNCVKEVKSTKSIKKPATIKKPSKTATKKTTDTSSTTTKKKPIKKETTNKPELSVAELRKLATDKNIPGRSKMTKDELKKALKIR